MGTFHDRRRKRFLAAGKKMQRRNPGTHESRTAALNARILPSRNLTPGTLHALQHLQTHRVETIQSYRKRAGAITLLQALNKKLDRAQQLDGIEQTQTLIRLELHIARERYRRRVRRRIDQKMSGGMRYLEVVAQRGLGAPVVQEALHMTAF